MYYIPHDVIDLELFYKIKKNSLSVPQKTHFEKLLFGSGGNL